MKKLASMLLLLPLSGCFMLPYNVQSDYRRQDESSEKRNTALNAVYAPPRLSISIEGDGHSVTIPEAVTANCGANSIAIGENTEIDESTKESAFFSKKIDTTTMLLILLLVMGSMGLLKKLVGFIAPQLQLIAHHYKKD